MPNSVQDPKDMTLSYNTALTPEEEIQYQTWADSVGHGKDTYDYDMRGAWKSGAAQADNGHFPDTFKKPNHPTFSDESQYNDGKTFKGGQWTKDSRGRDTFVPGVTNLDYHQPSELVDYFLNAEPDASIHFKSKPPQKKGR